MRAVSASANSRPTTSVGLHSSVANDVESIPKDVSVAPINNDGAEKVVAVRLFDQQTYGLEKG